MNRKGTVKKVARISLYPLVLLAIIGIVFIAVSEYIKNYEQMPKALAGSVVRPEETSSEISGPSSAKGTYKIMIDAGHGGKDPGAAGHSGVEEKVSNLAIAMKVYELLRQDELFEVRMTRTDDTFVELEDRAAMANGWKADYMVSIHGNTYEDEEVSGTETYYRYDNGLQLATVIQRKLVEAMGFRDRGVRYNELKVLTLSEMPSVLIETGYLTNASEEAVLLSEQGQSRVAQAIVDGLIQYVTEQGTQALR